MKIKQRPEDFSVKESYRFDAVPSGRFRVYLMDKQKLSTFDAVDRIRDRYGLKPGSISYCGLKDKQGRTEQLIAVDGADVDLQEPDLRLKYLGRADAPLTAANTTSNRFSVTVRALDPGALGNLNLAAAEVNRLGVVNYFDSQRFGSLKHGQGFIAKDLIRGDFEAALKNYMAKPSELDRSEDAKVKAFWQQNWGQWSARVPFAGQAKYGRILHSLKNHPEDFRRAFLQIEASHRAMLLFTYQSYLWNEGVRRYLQLCFPREHLFPMPYQAGTLLFHRDAVPEVLNALRGASFPLLSPATPPLQGQIKEAVDWVMGKEKLTQAALTIPGAEKLLYFKHELRPILVYPQKLVLGRTQRDELSRDQLKLNVAFTLPPGSYATLVIKRLFHDSYREENKGELLEHLRNREAYAVAKAEAEAREEDARVAPPTARPSEPPRRHPVRPARADRPARVEQPPALGGEPPPPEPRGYRAHQEAKKQAKRAAQALTRASRKPATKPSKRP